MSSVQPLARLAITTTGTPYSRASSETSTDTSVTTSRTLPPASTSPIRAMRLRKPACWRGAQCRVPAAVTSAAHGSTTPSLSPGSRIHRPRQPGGTGALDSPTTEVVACAAIAAARCACPLPW